jgi:hypothetical protein
VPRFKIIAGGQARLYDILDDALTAGSAVHNAIRLEHDDVAEVHVKVWRAEDGVWVGAVATAPLRVNGAPAARHRLRHGDRVELGAHCALEFIDAAAKPTAPKAAPAASRASKPAPSPAVSPPAAPRRQPTAAPPVRSAAAAEHKGEVKLVVPSAAREARERRSTRAHREEQRAQRHAPAGPRWHLITGLLLLSAAVVWVGAKLVSTSVGVKSAEDLLALAETQLTRGNPQAALQTAQTAAARSDASEELRRRITAFEGKIKQAAQVAADAPVLDLARQGLENLKVFEKSYLSATPTARPACREFVRIADAWHQRYATTCERYPDSQGLVQEAAALRARYAAHAQLDEPDNVDDVMFAARRATRLKRPRYRDAIAGLDAFLAKGGDAAVLARATTYRDELTQAGRAWFEAQLERMQREFDRGRSDAVLSEAEILLAECVLEEWKPELQAKVTRWKQQSGR